MSLKRGGRPEFGYAAALQHPATGKVWWRATLTRRGKKTECEFVEHKWRGEELPQSALVT